MRQIRLLDRPQERIIGEMWTLRIVVVPSRRWSEGWTVLIEPRYIYDHEGD